MLLISRTKNGVLRYFKNFIQDLSFETGTYVFQKKILMVNPIGKIILTLRNRHGRRKSEKLVDFICFIDYFRLVRNNADSGKLLEKGIRF